MIFGNVGETVHYLLEEATTRRNPFAVVGLIVGPMLATMGFAGALSLTMGAVDKIRQRRKNAKAEAARKAEEAKRKAEEISPLAQSILDRMRGDEKRFTPRSEPNKCDRVYYGKDIICIVLFDDSDRLVEVHLNRKVTGNDNWERMDGKVKFTNYEMRQFQRVAERDFKELREAERQKSINSYLSLLAKK